MTENLEVKSFPKLEYGVEYIEKWRNVKKSVDHVSLSKPFPRFGPHAQYEQVIRDVVLSNTVKVRYIANFTDEARLRRVTELLTKPEVQRYMVASIDLEHIKLPFFNFLIFDNEEVVLGIPSIEDEDRIIAIRNSQFVSGARNISMCFGRTRHHLPKLPKSPTKQDLQARPHDS